MRLHLNQRLVRRNSLFAKVMVGAGLAILVAGLIVSFVRPEQINIVLVSALVGIVASQSGIQLVNRWARNPRVDEIISNSLKGMDDQYALFHYLLGTDHALVSPAGVFALVPQLEEGKIAFEDERWWQYRKKGGLLRRSGRRSLGDLGRGALREAELLRRKLVKMLPADEEEYEVEPVLVFLHHDADLKLQDPPLAAVHVKKLKSELRKMSKGGTLARGQLDRLTESLTR